MKVLIDTSVWVGHFKKSNVGLIELIIADMALTHPMVLVELACGTPPAPRTQTLSDIGLLQQSVQASTAEVIQLIEREKLSGLECGLVDISLLASTLITPGASLWTLDKRLAAMAERFSVAFTPHRY
jgi:predicted nucleic acid-binding protein